MPDIEPIQSAPPAGQAPAVEPAVAAKDSPTDILHFEKWLGILGERKATDLHLAAGNVPLLRVDGAIIPLLDEEILTPERLERIATHLLSETEIKQLQDTKEVVTSRTLKKAMRFRLHAFYSRGFITISLRHVSSLDLSPSELGLPAAVLAMAKASQGLLIITGPFDAGKTTTIKTILSDINRTQAKYIITFERPIEYLIPSDKSVVVQREVGRDTSDFATGLDSLAEEDVNIVVVGAVDDAATAEHVLRLATTGRLVIMAATSRQSVGAIEKIRDLFVGSDQNRILNLLADSLVGVVAQILLPKVGGGRTLVAEILQGTNPVKSLIRDNKLVQIRNLMLTARQEGMLTMDKSLADAVKAGRVSLQDAREQAIDPTQFSMLISH
ncbi:MAG: ATPase, T2SS/T4P/T4SS family [Candidatus Komeilibacteria bacterium]|nr:ATPase, T2SS/T4P/T4SS family [Candidatus Komeilibacteria bacterium]